MAGAVGDVGGCWVRNHLNGEEIEFAMEAMVIGWRSGRAKIMAFISRGGMGVWPLYGGRLFINHNCVEGTLKYHLVVVGWERPLIVDIALIRVAKYVFAGSSTRCSH
jgi:hypothetical protein